MARSPLPSCAGYWSYRRVRPGPRGPRDWAAERQAWAYPLSLDPVKHSSPRPWIVAATAVTQFSG